MALTSIMQGIAPVASIDFTNYNVPLQAERTDPLFEWLMTTPASMQVLAAINKGGLDMLRFDESNNKWILRLPFNVYTTPPGVVAATDCCYDLVDVNVCQNTAELFRLCIHMCTTGMSAFMQRLQKFGNQDLAVGELGQRTGMTTQAARLELMRSLMKFWTEYSVLRSTSSTRAPGLLEFRGLYDIMNQPNVLKITASDPLAALQSIACRALMLDGFGAVMAMHPLLYNSTLNSIQPDRFGNYPPNVTRTNDSFSYMGIPIIKSKHVPIDMLAGTGEIYVLSGDAVGAWLYDKPAISNPDLIIEEKLANNQVSSGCYSECIYMFNFGTAFTLAPQKLMVIQGVNLFNGCDPQTLQGLDNIIEPITPLPQLS